MCDLVGTALRRPKVPLFAPLAGLQLHHGGQKGPSPSHLDESTVTAMQRKSEEPERGTEREEEEDDD